ncbi:MAG TPA: SIMPL domain-containing protein [Longimicrobium sp.]|nr:SIMPL domain-containing protein [Longimicrobium sp.]
MTTMRPPRRASLLLAAAALACAAAPAHAQPDRTPPGIRVSATGEVRAQPDLATADFGVETTGTTARAAAEENARRMERVIAALVAAGVERTRIETRDYMVFPDYEERPGMPGEPRIRGYRVTNTVSATVTDVSRVGALIDAALAGGANRAHGVRFSLRDAQRFRAQALQDAVRRARADAEALASALGVTLGMLREAYTTEMPMVMPIMNARGADLMVEQASPTPIQAQELTIRATVVLVFAFMN